MKNAKSHIRKIRQAFSLLEILITLSAVALMMSIAIPAINDRITASETTKKASQLSVPAAYAQIGPDTHAALDYAIAVTKSPENVARLIVKTNDANPEIGNITSFDAKLAAMKNDPAKYQTPQTVLDTMAQGTGLDRVIAWIDIGYNGKLALRTAPKPNSI